MIADTSHGKVNAHIDKGVIPKLKVVSCITELSSGAGGYREREGQVGSYAKEFINAQIFAVIMAA